MPKSWDLSHTSLLIICCCLVYPTPCSAGVCRSHSKSSPSSLHTMVETQTSNIGYGAMKWQVGAQQLSTEKLSLFCGANL